MTSEPRNEVTGQHEFEGQALARVRLADRLMNQLRQQILSGRLEPGQPLPSEKEICEAFAVGRTTVREALQGLVATGFVQRDGKQLIVQDVTLLDSEDIDYAALGARLSVREVFETRQLIEVETARLAAGHRTEADLTYMGAVLARMHNADPEEYHTADIDFHLAVAHAAKNRVLVEVYTASIHLFFKLPAFWRVFGKGEQEHHTRPPVGGGHAVHEGICEAIAARDERLASQRMFDHLEVVKQNLVERIATSGELSTPSPGDPVDEFREPTGNPPTT